MYSKYLMSKSMSFLAGFLTLTMIFQAAIFADFPINRTKEDRIADSRPVISTAQPVKATDKPPQRVAENPLETAVLQPPTSSANVQMGGQSSVNLASISPSSLAAASKAWKDFNSIPNFKIAQLPSPVNKFEIKIDGAQEITSYQIYYKDSLADSWKLATKVSVTDSTGKATWKDDGSFTGLPPQSTAMRFYQAKVDSYEKRDTQGNLLRFNGDQQLSYLKTTGGEEFFYNDQGALIRINLPNSGGEYVTDIRLDADGGVEAAIYHQQDGSRVVLNKGKVVRVMTADPSRPDEIENTLDYDESGHLSKVVMKDGTTLFYDFAGKLTKLTRPDGLVATEITLDASGKIQNALLTSPNFSNRVIAGLAPGQRLLVNGVIQDPAETATRYFNSFFKFTLSAQQLWKNTTATVILLGGVNDQFIRLKLKGQGTYTFEFYGMPSNLLLPPLSKSTYTFNLASETEVFIPLPAVAQGTINTIVIRPAAGLDVNTSDKPGIFSNRAVNTSWINVSANFKNALRAPAPMTAVISAAVNHVDSLAPVNFGGTTKQLTIGALLEDVNKSTAVETTASQLRSSVDFSRSQQQLALQAFQKLVTEKVLPPFKSGDLSIDNPEYIPQLILKGLRYDVGIALQASNVVVSSYEYFTATPEWLMMKGAHEIRHLLDLKENPQIAWLETERNAYFVTYRVSQILRDPPEGIEAQRKIYEAFKLMVGKSDVIAKMFQIPTERFKDLSYRNIYFSPEGKLVIVLFHTLNGLERSIEIDVDKGSLVLKP